MVGEQKIKVAVTGAAGQIGYALLFRIAAGEMFGPDVQVDMNLLELESAMGALQGVVMELEDCAFPLLGEVQTSFDPLEAFADVDYALLVGSVPRKAGMERGDLLKINAQVFVRQGDALSQSAKKDCKVLVVGNPCNTNALIAKERATRLDPANFFAMTMLDQNRAVSQLATKAGVSARDVSDVIVWGNHSATQFPDPFHAKIKGRPAAEVITDLDWLQGPFIETVQKRGAAIIQARGASSAASAANAVVDTVRVLEGRHVQKGPMSIALVSDGSYGVPEGLVYSFPVVHEDGGIKICKGLEHNEFAQEKLRSTRDELIKERDEVMSFIDQT